MDIPKATRPLWMRLRAAADILEPYYERQQFLLWLYGGHRELPDHWYEDQPEVSRDIVAVVHKRLRSIRTMIPRGLTLLATDYLTKMYPLGLVIIRMEIRRARAIEKALAATGVRGNLDDIA